MEEIQKELDNFLNSHGMQEFRRVLIQFAEDLSYLINDIANQIEENEKNKNLEVLTNE